MASRVRGSHKTGVERALLTVRARIQTALDALEEEGGTVRMELEEAAKALRALEVRLSTERTRGPATERLLEDEQMTSAETRDFLLKNFTEHDFEAADTNEEIQSTSSSPSMMARKSRSSIQIAEDVHKAMSAPDVAAILSKCGGWDFDALALAESPQAAGRCITVFGACVVNGGHMFKDLQQKHWISDSTRFMEAWLAFCSKLDGLYRLDAVYHGAAHAVDVAATTHWLMNSDYMTDHTTGLDQFLAVAAAALHDVGHPGQNNLWHVKTMSPLAIRYNDKSVLENMHVALAFETMQGDPECNWFTLLQRSSEGGEHTNLQTYSRKSLISMVLATDMVRHTAHVQELKSLAEEHKEAMEHQESQTPTAENEKASKQKALERKLFLLETVVHAADISNPSKPRNIMLGWTYRVLSEFWNQGDEERRLGLDISPLCDRESGMAAVPKGQLGFISFVVMPFLRPLADLLTEAQEAVEELEGNMAFWKEQDAAGTSFEALFGGPPLSPPRLAA